MAISGIISVSGRPGLFKVVTQTKNGLIAESLLDQKRIPVYASQKVSALEEISIYTTDDDMPLADVFDKMYEKTGGKSGPSHKDTPEQLRSFFGEVIENYDPERVYNSDLKKLFQWFNLLIDKGLLEPEKEEKKSKKDGEEGAEKKAKPAASKAKKATTKAKSTPKPKAPKASASKAAMKSAPRKAGGK